MEEGDTEGLEAIGEDRGWKRLILKVGGRLY